MFVLSGWWVPVSIRSGHGTSHGSPGSSGLQQTIGQRGCNSFEMILSDAAINISDIITMAGGAKHVQTSK